MQPVHRKILLVEDERSIADTVTYALKTEGFEASWVRTGLEAIERLAEETFDAIVLDVGLPDVDGFDPRQSLQRCPL